MTTYVFIICRISLYTESKNSEGSMDAVSYTHLNIDSMLYSYQTVLRYMMKKKIRGSFLNFSSSTALAYNGSAVQGYPFSKACIKLATQNMVNQVSKKYGIRFNCLAPNYVWVPKQEKVWDMYREHFEATTPMPYVGMPEDAAWAVVYPVSYTHLLPPIRCSASAAAVMATCPTVLRK